MTTLQHSPSHVVKKCGLLENCNFLDMHRVVFATTERGADGGPVQWRQELQNGRSVGRFRIANALPCR